MYIRRKRTPTGEVLQLIESYRNAEGSPRQRILLSLGDAAMPESLWPTVARAVADRLKGQASMFAAQAPAEAAQWVDTIVRRLEVKKAKSKANDEAGTNAVASPTLDGVLLDEIEHRDSAVLGPILAGWHIWNALGMPEFLERTGFSLVQRNAAAIEVINRLVDPVSENALQSWCSRTALPELLGADSLPTLRDSFYRSCDQLHKHKDAIFAHLRRRERDHFGLRRTILLYDLTNTHFEGEMLGNPKAKRGRNKQKRNDCPQVVVGMAFDNEGFEVGHEVFEGNLNDGKSLVKMVKHLRKAIAEEAGVFASQRPLVIVDGGIATAANRKLFLEEGFDFLANDSRPGRKKYAEWFAQDREFTAIPERAGTAAVLVRKLQDPLAADPDQADTLILCKSEGRREKENAILSRAEQRFLDAITRLRATVDKGKRKKREAIERSLARILSRNPRVTRYYRATVTEAADKKFVICCERKQDNYDDATALLGCYVLRTSSMLQRDAIDWWELYMTLTQAENGFRALKSDLGLRPNRHQREDRGDSHILVSVLAYHLLHWITFTLRKHGDFREWTTIRRILSTHCYATTCLATQDGGHHRIRKAGRPDEEQQQIYHRLGINWKDLPANHFSD